MIKHKLEFSKLIILLETAIVCYVTYKTMHFIGQAIATQYTGSLPYLTALIGAVWGAYGTSLSFYYNKAKAENVMKIKNMNRDL